MAENEIIIFGLHLNIDPVAFNLFGKWEVRWYGIIIAFGFALALIYAMRNAKRFDVNSDKMLDVVLVTTPLAVLCARAYYLIFDGNGIQSISQFFGFDGSGFAGLAIYGGVIGAVVVGGIMCKIKKINILSMFDMVALGFLIGQGIGRWGNFTNQEAFGTATGSSWFGMTSNNVEKVLGSGQLAHPCFLYESIWCILGFVLLHIWSKKRKFPGQIAFGYCVWYGIGRFFIEGIRTDSLYIGTTSIRVSQALSLAIVLLGAAALAVMFKRSKEKAKAEAYENVFGEFEDAYLSEEGTKENSDGTEEAEKSNQEIISEENKDENN